MSYLVAFRGTKASGGYEGVITWTNMGSKEKFDQWCESPEGKSSLEQTAVLEEGITPERAIELVRSTPISSRIMVAIQEATNPENGLIDKGRAHHAAAKAAFAIGHLLGPPQ